MSQKPSDEMTIPLCFTAHNLQHSIGEKTFHGDIERARKLASDLYEVSGDWEKGAQLILIYRRGL